MKLVSDAEVEVFLLSLQLSLDRKQEQMLFSRHRTKQLNSLDFVFLTSEKTATAESASGLAASCSSVISLLAVGFSREGKGELTPQRGSGLGGVPLL